MNDGDGEFQIETHDIWAAASLLTRLPVPVNHERAGQRGADAAWAFPLVGVVLGLFAGVVAYCLSAIGLPSGMPELCALATLAILTGGLHEDGLADCADGFWGAMDAERRLEIMKDSRIGAYGTLALIFTVLLTWLGLLEIGTERFILVLIGISALSRLPMVLAMYSLPNARQTGMAARAGTPSRLSVAIATTLCVAISVTIFGWLGLPILVFVILATLPLFIMALRKLGGQTGDVLGASQQIGMIAAIVAIILLT
ncbi:adenosylcobinamide-GDP ribazoletransferase [Amylibacter ulvae]|uniref:Adenosylcobinamide-GDP ribazoletransferase n=1 Tax=Paramylibacter ulvae TaxID=1651968 RepID=A0ABQ3DB72_9RHOB|nr:adenosylcobinamide-GDP ribazoletransferase [Amylibacter ulvae]GHA62411.1 adenosylcobinamide-GDP ribazoletransferase [Amylibacter ulvae]